MIYKSMDTLIHEITLGFSNETGIPNIPVSQHDINRIISVRFTNYGEEYEIPEGTYVFLKAKKPDGTEINTDEFCSVADHKVKLQIFEQLTVAGGIVPCEIILSDENGTRYTSSHFNLIINHSVHNDDHLRSSDTYKNLADMIVEHNNIAAKEKIRTENENQRMNNEQKRENMFSNVLDHARSYSDNAQNSSDSARESNESAANHASQSENWARRAKEEADRAKEEADRAHNIEMFSGSYNDLSDKPVIPTKTSQLTNDSGFKTTDTTYSAGPQLTLAGTQIDLHDVCKLITDWNDARANGWYMGHNALHQPDSGIGWHYGLVIAHHPSYARQIVYSFADGVSTVATLYGRYERIIQNNKWGEWYRTDVSLTNNLLSNQPGTALDAAQAPVLVGKINTVDNKVAAINNTLKDLTGYIVSTVLENEYMDASYFKNGNVVEIALSKLKTELTAGVNYTIGVLPENCRPPYGFSKMVALGTSNITMAYFSISKYTGEVQIKTYNHLPVGTYIYNHFTFSCR